MKREAAMQLNIGDLRGGFSAAVVLIPQAMAFGATLWTLAGGSASDGAFAGLLSAALLSFCTGLAGGCQGIICSPTGPSLVLLSGAVAAMQTAGAAPGMLPVSIAIIVMLAGLIQIAIGFVNGGQLIKYIPYPVIAGFMTGSAILMIKSQLPAALGMAPTLHWRDYLTPPVIASVSAFAAMGLAPKQFPALPGTLAGLIAGFGAFHLFSWLGSITPHAAWMIGALPGLDNVRFGVPLQHLPNAPWQIVIGAAVSLALLASLNTLLTAVIADGNSGARHDARKVLIGQGFGLLLNGFFGGIGGSATTGATLISVSGGGRRWSGVYTGIILALLVVFCGSAAALLPLSALAGIILYIAVFGLIEPDIVFWLGHRKTRGDAFTAALVTLVTVAYDLVAAVAVGVALAVTQFVYSQIKAPVIHLRTTAIQRPSLRRRPETQRRLLAQHGERIVTYELTGNLFFGAVDRLFEEMHQDIDRPAWVILDMGRVTQFDLSAIKILQQIAKRLHKNQGELIFATVRSGRGMGRKVKKTLKKISPHGQNTPIKTFIDADEAIEYAEDALLAQLQVAPIPPELPMELCAMGFLQTFTDAEIAGLRKNLRELRINKGEYLFRAGDWGEQLFIIVRGEIDILLPFGKHHYKRIATFGPGTYFGEVAFLEPGPRAASAKATFDAQLLALDQEGFERLLSESPSAAVSLLKTLGQTLSKYLRWADVELKQLMEW
jgi:SulP family sulfate permease